MIPRARNKRDAPSTNSIAFNRIYIVSYINTMTRVTPDNLVPRKCPNKFASMPPEHLTIPLILQLDIAIDNYKIAEKLFSFNDKFVF